MNIVRSAADPLLVDAGGKGRSLLELSEFADLIPPFVVLVGVQDAHLEEILAGIQADSERLGPRLAVRSSANVEDQEKHNYSGLFESRLGVPVHDLGAAVAEVMSSVSSERVHSYSERIGIDPALIQMSLILQSMVESESAGVAMSLDHRGRPQVCIEAVFGLGEQLVSGREAGDRYLVPDDGSEPEITVRPQRNLLAMSEGTGITERAIPFFKRNRQKLDGEQIRSVAQLTGRLQATTGGPVVVEFAFAAARLWLLQCRPLPASAR